MNKKNLVKKSNSLVEARCNLTLNQQKIIVSVISMIKREDEDFKEYKLSIYDFKKIMELKGTGRYNDIKSAARELRKKELIIKTNENEELITGWFSSIRIDYEGEVGFCFDPKLKPFLIQLKSHFTVYQLQNILLLKSKYSVRLYELLKQYQKLEHRAFEILELRELLYIEPDQYTRFSNFRNKILDFAIEDINKNTDIKVSYTLTRHSRKVSEVNFLIKKQAQKKQQKLIPKQIKIVPQELLNLIPKEERKACNNICIEILEKDGKNGLKFYLKKCNNRKQSKNSSFSGYLKTIFDLDLYADYAEQEKKIQARLEEQQAKQLEEMKKYEEEIALKAKRQKQIEELDFLKSNNPDKYFELQKQAGDDLGIDPENLKLGQKMSLILRMIDLNQV